MQGGDETAALYEQTGMQGDSKAVPVALLWQQLAHGCLSSVKWVYAKLAQSQALKPDHLAHVAEALGQRYFSTTSSVERDLEVRLWGQGGVRQPQPGGRSSPATCSQARGRSVSEAA